MKKIEVILFLFAILYIGVVYGQAGVSIAFSVKDISGPGINFFGLVNNSGISSRNFTISYNASDFTGIGSCGWSIDDQLNFTNSTFDEGFNESEDDFFDGHFSRFKLENLDIGSFDWGMNCTDNLGFVSNSDIFKFHVILLEGFNGSSTDVSQVNVGKIPNFVTEISTLGTINFSGFVNLEGGFDLAKFINISSNKIALDSNALGILNRSATLYLYNLNLTKPQVIIDDIVCPAEICKNISFNNGTFIFNVTHFTSFSANESPVEEEEESGTTTTTTTTTTTGGGGTIGGGGGGGGGRNPSVAKREFTLSTETLKVILKQGQTKEEKFTIKNTGDLAISLETNLEKLLDFIIFPNIKTIKTVLQPGEEETIFLTFMADENLKPDIYPKQIFITEVSGEKIISAVIEVESAQPLFDVDVEVLPEFKNIFPGDNIFLEVSLFNVRGFGRVDVELEYAIRDFQGNVIALEQETVAIETQAKFSRELLIPRDTKPGTYVASAKVTFGESVGISSDIFEIKAKSIRLYPIAIKDYTFYLLFGITIIIIISVFIMYKHYPLKEKYVPKTKEESRKLIKTEEKIKKLEKQISALESAYDSRFISLESFEKNKGRIGKELKKLRRQV